MSRVFLAEDVALHRDVVIKVLHPELAAGVNAERFNREVLLSARLQHPHIVPVLSAGQLDGLPYYVMPFVKGQTLHDRIAAGPLPVGEIVGILGDVAKALGYAHSENVVHRDIKPDNILLSGGAATVADFGIAKALSSARHQEAGEALTSLGMSLGTPAYMAPEQVAGDPGTDHRADIYALGCVAFEMLTRRSPFAGKSPQQMLAAHVMEVPKPVAQLRPGIPPALSALVMRCLEKEPALRPQSAQEVASALETTGGYEVMAPVRSAWGKRRVLIAGGGLVLLSALGVAAYRSMRAPVAATGALNLAVAPFEVLDPQLMLWKEGMVDVLSRNLDGAGPIRSLSPSITIKRWEGRAERAAAVEFGKRVGAQIVMYGQLQSSGRDLVNARVWILDVERDASPLEIEVRDSVARMDRVSDSLSIRSLAAIGRMRTIGAAQLASLGSSSLPAIRFFLHGAQYFRRAQWDSAAAALRDAVAVDSTFGIAYAMLGESYGWTGGGDNERQWQAFASAGAQIRPGLSPHDSLTLAAVGHYAQWNKRGPNSGEEIRQAFAAAGAVTQQYPDDAPAWYLYGDMRYHHDRTITEREALGLFDRAIRADSDFAPAYIHAIELAYRNGAPAGEYYAAAYLSRAPASLTRSSITLAADMASGRLHGAPLAAVLDTVSPLVGGSALTALRRLPDSAEATLAIVRAEAKRNPGSGMRSTRSRLADVLAFRGHISEAWRMGIESPTYTMAEIAVLGLVPADSAARVLGPWVQRHDDASFFALPALGAARDAAQLNTLALGAERFAKTDTSTRTRAGLAYFSASARAYAALARGDTSVATQLFDTLNDSTLALPIDQFIRARLVGRTDPKRALGMLNKMSENVDLLYVARELERARLAEKVGDGDSAVAAYAYVAAAWRNTDSPRLRDAVKESTSALARLDADGRRRASLTSTVR
jgi:tRNA A-37 threonylcarbamoyl transferase component Bud32/tetratricopeptide (TPR) repeat protein